MQGIFIFGGSFDPVHSGHIAMIQAVLAKKTTDFIFLVPTGEHPQHKKYTFTPLQRMIMLKLSLGILLDNEELLYLKFVLKNYPQYDDLLKSITQETNNRIVLRRDELDQQEKSYTIFLINKLQSEFPNAHFNLLIGGDQAMNFAEWYQSEQIAQKVSLWVYNRQNSILDPRFFWHNIESKEYNISSSQIKLWLNENKGLFDRCDLIPQPVKILAPIFLEKHKD
ncbi:MAG: nicotinate-nicotinamide nucleotide adenylyltransferase [Brevinema sp.]